MSTVSLPNREAMAKSYFESIRGPLENTADVRKVFGEPIHLEGRTIIPVARVAYGFGGGFGSQQKSQAEAAERGGGGGGGGVRAMPAGVIEVTPTATRFVPITDGKRLAAAAGFGLLVGMLFGRRRKR